MTLFGQPIIPRHLLHTMYDIQSAAPTYSAENGGQWKGGEPEEIPFEGVILPISEADLRKAPQGTYTKESRKIYTNGYKLRVGAQVTDPQDGATYTVTGDLNYGLIHPMRRYVVERKGAAAAK